MVESLRSNDHSTLMKKCGQHAYNDSRKNLKSINSLELYSCILHFKNYEEKESSEARIKQKLE